MKTVFRILLLCLVMAQAARCERVSGDLDGNGVVDFADFIIFADNFGKTGDPYDPNIAVQATIYDTVKVHVQELTPPPEAGTIPGLVAIHTIIVQSANWDADVEVDGFQLQILMADGNGALLNYQYPGGLFRDDVKIAEGLTVILELKVYDRQTKVLRLKETHTGLLKAVLYSRIERERLDPFDGEDKIAIYVKLTTPEQGSFEAITPIGWAMPHN